MRFSACRLLWESYFLSTNVDAGVSSLWKTLYSLPFELEKNIGWNYSLLMCGYVRDYDGDPHNEDDSSFEDENYDFFEDSCGPYLVSRWNSLLRSSVQDNE